ncbi:MAG: hypothetical protein JNM88_04655 [Chitinophagaceae bacterium]|nr:hypothetical protein [Chitinophagaceae bacterium]
MPENLKDILSNLNTEIDQETLLQYLQGQLPADKKHEVEKQLLLDPFADDAAEGLEEFEDKGKLQYMVEMLNRDLKKTTEKKKKRREKMRFKDQPWLYFSVLILIFLIVICYIAIRYMVKKD